MFLDSKWILKHLYSHVALATFSFLFAIFVIPIHTIILVLTEKLKHVDNKNNTHSGSIVVSSCKQPI
jgi:hypothetical protein